MLHIARGNGQFFAHVFLLKPRIALRCSIHLCSYYCCFSTGIAPTTTKQFSLHYQNLDMNAAYEICNQINPFSYFFCYCTV